MKTILSLLFSAGMIFILLTSCNSSKAVVVGEGESTHASDQAKELEKAEQKAIQKSLSNPRSGQVLKMQAK